VRLIDWSRGTAVRIAALTSILVIAVVSLLGIFVYALVNDAMQGRVRAQISEEIEQVIADHGPVDQSKLIAAIESRTHAGVFRRFAYRLTKPDGTHITGDAWIAASFVGWHWQQIDQAPDRSRAERRVLVLTRDVGSNLFVSIARDAHWITDLEQELGQLLLRALGLAVVAALFVSMLVKRLIGRRIADVTETARVVMNGNLTQRVPVSTAGDDFDRLAATLNEMLDRIRALMDGLSQVTNDIAHDLRTPLGRLRQKIEQVRDDAVLLPGHASALDQAIEEVDGLLATFTAMLRIAQIDSGARRSGFKSIDLGETVQTVCEAYEPNAEDTGHVLVAHVAEEVHIEGDRDLLAQMFANLVENALTHTPAGTTIRVSVRPSSTGMVVVVADNGPGVPAGEIDKIFGRFYRAEASRTTPGTGLGLSLAAAIARLHGGTITATDNAPGLRISVLFPTDSLA